MEYYYLADNDSDHWRYLKVARDDLNSSAEFGSVPKEYDIKLEYGYKGKMYIGTSESLSEPSDEVDGDYNFLNSPCKYRIFELSTDRSSCIYECTGSGMPSVLPSGQHVIIENNIKGEVILEDLNLESHETTTITQQEFTRDEDGKFNGTIVMGLDYDHTALQLTFKKIINLKHSTTKTV